MAKEWDGHEYVLVAEVNCNDVEEGGGRELCHDVGVTGYPTLKYGDPTNDYENLDDYEGGRRFEDMHTFTKENLKAPCSPKNPEQCSDETKQLFDEYTKMPLESLDKRLTELENKLNVSKDEFIDHVAKMKETYNTMNEEKNTKLETIKKSGLSFLKSIQKARGSSNIPPIKKDDEL